MLSTYITYPESFEMYLVTWIDAYGVTQGRQFWSEAEARSYICKTWKHINLNSIIFLDTRKSNSTRRVAA